MMSLESMEYLAKQAERKAKRTRVKPLVLSEVEDVDHLGEHGYRIPSIGAYVPAGWTLVDTWFCDSSGFGRPGELALTQDQLKARIRDKIRENKRFGYAVIQEGQFQVHLGVFEAPVRNKRAA
jgi:hypothetical protein